MTTEQELADLRAAVEHAAAQLQAAEAKEGDAPESARAHFREAVRTIARTLPPTSFTYDRAAVWGELLEMDRLHSELESLRRDAERWRAIAPLIRLESDGWDSVFKLCLVSGAPTFERAADRIVEEARKKP